MSAPKHTPGPWSTRTETFGSAREVLEDVERMLAAGGLHNFTITTVVAPDRLSNPPPGDGTVCVAYLGNGPTAHANGTLITRAPELLSENEALRARVAEMEERVEVAERHASARCNCPDVESCFLAILRAVTPPAGPAPDSGCRCDPNAPHEAGCEVAS